MPFSEWGTEAVAGDGDHASETGTDSYRCWWLDSHNASDKPEGGERGVMETENVAGAWARAWHQVMRQVQSLPLQLERCWSGIVNASAYFSFPFPQLNILRVCLTLWKMGLSIAGSVGWSPCVLDKSKLQLITERKAELGVFREITTWVRGGAW